MRAFWRTSGARYVDTNTSNQDSRIIFINRFYWPDASATSQLLTDLAEYTAATGRRVLVIASRLFYDDRSRLMPPYELRHGIEIRRVRTTRLSRHSLACQLVNFLTFYPTAAMTLFRETRRDDIIVVKTDPPLFVVVAWLIARLRKARVVNWCQDLFPEVAIGCGVAWAKGPVGATLRSLRNYALARSDVNVVVSPAMQNALTDQGVKTSRIDVIRNWSVGEIEPVPRSDNPLRQAWGLEDSFVIGYSGNLGRAHLAEQIHFLIRVLDDAPNVKFLFIGAGHGMERLQALCRRGGYRNVLFRPYQPKSQLSFSLSTADLHLVSLDASCQGSMSPSKYYGILAAGRPVVLVGARESVLAQEVERFNLGLVLDLRKVGAWRSLIDAVRKDKDRLIDLGQSARRFYEQRLAPRQSLDAWVNVIASQEATGGHSGRGAPTWPMQSIGRRLTAPLEHQEDSRH